MLLKNMKNHQIYLNIDPNLKKEFPNIRTYVNQVLELALNYLQKTEKNEVFEVSISLVNNIEIQKINQQYRNKNKPTDVLSFSQLEGEEIPRLKEEPLILGDIFISYEFAKKQSKELNHTFYEELLRLIIHGLYHLLGYDHERSKEEEKIMFDKEIQISEYLKSNKKIQKFFK